MTQDKLTKAEIVEHVFEDKRVNLSKAEIRHVIDLLFEDLKNALADDMVVELRGFGTFEIRTRKGRDKARNPRTGATAPVDTHGVAVFRPGKELKEIAWPLRG